MVIIVTILYFLAFLCFAFATARVPTSRFDLQSAGLALWMLALLIARV